MQNLTPDELEHYGVLGMKWGVRKDRYKSGSGSSKKKQTLKDRVEANKKKAEAKKQAAEKEYVKKNKMKILSSPTELYKYRTHFTKDEIDAAMKTFQWEKQLRELSRSEMNQGKDYINTALGYIQTSMNAYNMFAKIYNSFSDEGELPIIGEGKKKNN